MASLKIERDITKTVSNVADVAKDVAKDVHPKEMGFVGNTAAAIAEAASGQLPGTKGDHPIAAVVGTALTGGRKNAGTKGYLAVC